MEQIQSTENTQEPSSTSAFLDMIYQMNKVLDAEPGTILVHCSAGVGRTGTFIGLYKLIQDYLDSEVNNLFKTFLSKHFFYS